MQVHERVVQGLLQLDCLAGPDAPLEPAQALEGALAALVGHADSASSSGSGGQVLAAVPVLPAVAAWEVAALLQLQAKQLTGPEAALVPPEAGAVLQRLERPAQAAVQAAMADQQDEMREAGATEEEAVLPQVPAAAWRSLHLATALRHLLDPARVVRGQQQLAKKQPRRTGGSTAAPPLLPLALPQPQDVKPEDGQAEGQQQQQQAAPAQLSPEQLAQHGAFASLMLAAQEPPSQPQPAAAPPAQQQQQGEEAEEAGAEGQAQLLAEWRAAIERCEMLLLQRQLAAALTAALPEEGEDEEEDGAGGAGPMDLDGAAAEGGGGSGDAGSSGESRRSQLLMADWITLNVQDPQLLPEMLPLAARQGAVVLASCALVCRMHSGAGLLSGAQLLNMGCRHIPLLCHSPASLHVPRACPPPMPSTQGLHAPWGGDPDRDAGPRDKHPVLRRPCGSGRRRRGSRHRGPRRRRSAAALPRLAGALREATAVGMRRVRAQVPAALCGSCHDRQPCLCTCRACLHLLRAAPGAVPPRRAFQPTLLRLAGALHVECLQEWDKLSATGRTVQNVLTHRPRRGLLCQCSRNANLGVQALQPCKKGPTAPITYLWDATQCYLKCAMMMKLLKCLKGSVQKVRQ